MNFLADENVDRQIVDRLRQEGHHVSYVAEMDPGISDPVVLDLGNQQGLILVTADKDFGELLFRQGRLTAGVVLIRLAGLSPETKGEIVAAAVRQHASEFPDSFSVVSPSSVRIRRRVR